ncbi:MAG TPA: hypothetical protein VEI01_23860 [Terriglobales bacterium]|nr:hypothetical protein [Terriglobales bacterium]
MANILFGRRVRALGAREFWRTCYGAGTGASSPDCANRGTSQADGESADLQNPGTLSNRQGGRRPAPPLISTDNQHLPGGDLPMPVSAGKNRQ